MCVLTTSNGDLSHKHCSFDHVQERHVYLLVPVVQLLPQKKLLSVYFGCLSCGQISGWKYEYQIQSRDPFPSILQEFIKRKQKCCTKNKNIQILKKIHISKSRSVAMRPVAMRPVAIRSRSEKKETHPSVLEFSLSLYRHPSICILFSSLFTSYNKRNNPGKWWKEEGGEG